MKYNLFFYGIGFIILIITNTVINNHYNNSDDQLATFHRCLEIQKSLNLQLTKWLN